MGSGALVYNFRSHSLPLRPLLRICAMSCIPIMRKLYTFYNNIICLTVPLPVLDITGITWFVCLKAYWAVGRSVVPRFVCRWLARLQQHIALSARLCVCVCKCIWQQSAAERWVAACGSSRWWEVVGGEGVAVSYGGRLLRFELWKLICSC